VTTVTFLDVRMRAALSVPMQNSRSCQPVSTRRVRPPPPALFVGADMRVRVPIIAANGSKWRTTRSMGPEQAQMPRASSLHWSARVQRAHARTASRNLLQVCPRQYFVIDGSRSSVPS